MKRLCAPILILEASLAIALAQRCLLAQELAFAPYHSNGIYASGEQVGWTVRPAPGSAETAKKYSYTIRENNGKVVETGTLDLATGEAAITIQCDHPAMLFVTVTHPSEQTPPAGVRERLVATLGAAVAPTKIKPCLPPPEDFNAFWAEKLKALRKIPMHPELSSMPSPQADVKLFQVKLASLDSHVQGYLAEPAKPGKFPALIIYQWAGVYALQPGWAVSRAAQGWLTFDVDSHDIPPDQATGVPTDYNAIGDSSRETSYFLGMYLRDTRALDYIRSRPDWNGKTLVVTGTSMGGQQSLATAGLNPGKVTAVIVDEPSGADANGESCGRKTGYPFWKISNPKIAETAPYFDVVNFASHITAASLMAMGFIDEIAPPVGVWTAFNQIHAPKEAVPMILAAHNNITPQFIGPFLKYSEQALTEILKTGKFRPEQKIAP